MSNWKTGDVVVLKSGGPKMTVGDPVVQTATSTKVRCVYFLNGELKEALVAAETLIASPG